MVAERPGVAGDVGVAMARGGEAARDLRQDAVRELERGDQRAIDAAVGPPRHRLDTPRPLAGDEAHQADRVAAGVHQRAAGERGIEADVGAVEHGKAERRMNKLHAPDRARAQQLAHLQRLRLRAIRIGFDAG